MAKLTRAQVASSLAFGKAFTRNHVEYHLIVLKDGRPVLGQSEDSLCGEQEAYFDAFDKAMALLNEGREDNAVKVVHDAHGIDFIKDGKKVASVGDGSLSSGEENGYVDIKGQKVFLGAPLLPLQPLSTEDECNAKVEEAKEPCSVGEAGYIHSKFGEKTDLKEVMFNIAVSMQTLVNTIHEEIQNAR